MKSDSGTKGLGALLSWLPQLDAYDRVARLWPTLLAMAPILWVSPQVKRAIVHSGAASVFASLGLAGACVVLLMNVSRSRGKAIEPKLIRRWGGWRTTGLLRHRDRTLDRFTKERYHKALTTLTKGFRLPTEPEETADPELADERYRAATTRLIEKRRDRKYALLHKENAQYGFRRNLLGLKPIALCLVALALSLDVTHLWLGFPAGDWHAAIATDVVARPAVYVALGADIMCAVCWLLLIRPGFVRAAADEYAMALFRTLD